MIGPYSLSRATTVNIRDTVTAAKTGSMLLGKSRSWLLLDQNRNHLRGGNDFMQNKVSARLLKMCIRDRPSYGDARGLLMREVAACLSLPDGKV